MGVAKTPSLRRPHSTRWAPERGACVDVAVEVIEETFEGLSDGPLTKMYVLGLARSRTCW